MITLIIFGKYAGFLSPQRCAMITLNPIHLNKNRLCAQPPEGPKFRSADHWAAIKRLRPECTELGLSPRPLGAFAANAQTGQPSRQVPPLHYSRCRPQPTQSASPALASTTSATSTSPSPKASS